MKKIGIMTIYYNNDNYGGIAQAYALNKYISDLKYDSEIITYMRNKREVNLTTKNSNVKYIIQRVKNKIINKFIYSPIEKIMEKKYTRLLEQRHEKLQDFRNNIKHSVVYDSDSIEEIKDKYDIYITGSDQTWNPGCIDKGFVFDFLDNEKYNVFSYAPSIAVDQFSENYIEYMNKVLKKYKFISVREEKSRDNLKKYIDRDIEWVVDPTMLLEKKEWDSLATNRKIKEKYIISYILGNSKKQRKKVKRFAKEKGLKLVTIPYIKNGSQFKFKLVDYKFGDEQMIDISFGDFLSLIKYSEYVVTDSFHAVSFSYIFEKEFFVINRDSVISTNSRIDSILKILGLPERYITDKKIPLNVEKINYSEINKNARVKIDKSKKYLDIALNGMKH